MFCSIRIMLSRLIEEPWIEILQDEAVRLTDRLGIIFRFLEDEKVSMEFCSAIPCS